MILDLHCHLAGAGYGGSGCFVSPRLRRNPRYRSFLRAYGVDEGELRRCGDQRVPALLAAGLAASREVAGAVLLALDGAVDGAGRLDRSRTELYVPNRFVGRTVRAHPGLYFGASVHPGRRDALDRLEQAAAAGAVLVKWLPPVQGFDPADPAHRGFCRRLADLGLPLLVHTGRERSFSRSEDRWGDPERLRPALDAGVTVIAAHGAAAGRTDGEPNRARLARLFGRHPNLYADVSSLTQLNHPGALRRLLAAAPADRLLYGTDMPLLETPLVSPLWFLPRLGPVRTAALLRVRNPWDRDVALKRALGVPEAVFHRGAGLLGIRGPGPEAGRSTVT